MSSKTLAGEGVNYKIPAGERSESAALDTINNILKVLDKRPITLGNISEVFLLVEPYRVA